MVRDGSSSYKIDYVIIIKNCLNSKEPQNRISGSKVTVILLKNWILPIGGVASGRVCACSLNSKLIFGFLSLSNTRQQKHIFFFGLFTSDFADFMSIIRETTAIFVFVERYMRRTAYNRVFCFVFRALG